jgi:hypothetical protein
MIPKSGNRFSDKIMRNQKQHMMVLARMDNKPLVPAKAGTQGRKKEPRQQPWIPACAGMSGLCEI